MTRIRMEEKCFTFRPEYYNELKTISPYIREIYIPKLEAKLASTGLMPRFWKRNVDDIYPITSTHNSLTKVH